MDWNRVRLIRDRRLRTLVALPIALWLLPLPAWAQSVDSFEKVPLLVNLDDHVQVQDQSGAAYTGRLTRLTRRDLVIDTPDGEQRLTSDLVQTVAVRDHPLRTGALIGAASFAVIGSVAICAHKGGSGCALVGAVGAAPIGGGIGLVIGSFLPRTKTVYRAAEDRRAAPPRVDRDEGASLLEDLALHVNLNDRLRVEDPSGTWVTGRVADITANELTIHTTVGDRRFTRSQLRQVGVHRRHVRAGTLMGAAAGSIAGALSECGGGQHADCPDGIIIGAALGGGGGALVSALLHTTTVVYPEQDKQSTFITPHLSRGAFAITATRVW